MIVKARNAVLGLLLLATVAMVGLVTSPFGSPEAVPARKGPRPAPSASDGTYATLTGSWDTGRTAAITFTTGQGSDMPACGDIVCSVSPTKITIQVRRGDLVILVVAAVSGRGRAFCSIRLPNERDAELVKPYKNASLDSGAVKCSRRIP